MKKTLTILGLIFSVTLAWTQSWEIGLHVGTPIYRGDLVLDDIINFDEINIGYGAYLKRNFSEKTALRLHYLGGKISGSDQNFAERLSVDPNLNFESTINEIALIFEYNLRKRQKTIIDDESGTEYVKTRKMTPYLLVGAALGSFDPEVGVNPGSSPATPETFDTEHFMAPIGFGFKFFPSEKITIGIEAMTHISDTDFMDGISATRDPDDNDWLSHLNLSLGLNLGVRDTDGDGITDGRDECPETPGIKAFAGCPDSDADGIKDMDDACPNTPGLAEFNGCPDSDGDKIIDSKDSCPNTPGLASLNGCPDADSDGIADGDDACPNEAGLSSLRGCPDTDGDGIADGDDDCPTEAGLAINKGCPIIDADGDGIADADDRCPNDKGSAALGGCPDTDGDGLADIDDKCPTSAGPASNNGCPEIKKEDKEVLQFALRNVQFETNSAKLATSSHVVLDNIVGLMKKYPDYNLSISGHTDNTGAAAYNQILSENRAKSCRDYMASKGVPSNRMSYAGYGETQPIANNNTSKGRKENRRTVFSMSLK